MDELFGKIDCRSKYDSIVMRLLRSAMDKAHEKVQNMNGPVEFLHERSKFYEFAAILVEAGLNIVKEETEIHESNREKIVGDLMEIKDWLQGRNEEMTMLIIEKDKELMESTENGLKLRHAMELNERELVYIRDKLELERTKSNRLEDFLRSNREIHEDEAKVGDVQELRNSVDQQALNIKLNLEQERRKKSLSNVSDSEVYSRIFDDDRSPGARSVEDELHRHEHFFDIKPSNRTFKPGKNNKMIQQMSSDIAILKKTLGLAFGRMQNARTLPLEKQWRWTIEKDAILAVIRGFIRDIPHILSAELKNGGCETWGCVFRNKVMTNDLKSLRDELNALRNPNIGSEVENSIPNCSSPSSQLWRISSEPLSGASSELVEGHLDHVARMIRNHESITQKHHEERSWLTREILLWKGSPAFVSGTKPDGHDSRILRIVTRLDSLIAYYNNQIDEKHACDETNFPTSAIGEQLHYVIREGNGRLSFENSIDDHRSIQENFPNSKVGVLEESSLSNILDEYLESSIRKEIYAVYLQQTVEKWNKSMECNADNRLFKKGLCQLPSCQSANHITDNTNLLIRQLQAELEDSRGHKADIPGPNVFQDTIGSLIREDIYLVYFRDLASVWRTEREDYELERIIKEDIHQVVIVEKMRETREMIRESEASEHMVVQRNLPPPDKWDIDVRESLKVKLDNFLNHEKCGGHFIIKNPQDHVGLSCDNVGRNGSAGSNKLKTDTDLSHANNVFLSNKKHTFCIASNSQNLVDHPDQPDHTLAAESRGKCNACQLAESEPCQLRPSSELVGFQQAVTEFEQLVHNKLDEKRLRLEDLKNQVTRLAQPMVSMRQRKMLYKKAFLNRCINLQLAENEVDLLGNQVDKLLGLLQKTYLILHQNAKALSSNVEVSETLLLIKNELAG